MFIKVETRVGSKEEPVDMWLNTTCIFAIRGQVSNTPGWAGSIIFFTTENEPLFVTQIPSVILEKIVDGGENGS